MHVRIDGCLLLNHAKIAESDALERLSKMYSLYNICIIKITKEHFNQIRP